MGANDLEQFIELFWEAFYINCDVNDLLAQLWTWWTNDLGDHPDFAGDFDAALGAIRARTIILNAETDRYFLRSIVNTKPAVFPTPSCGRFRRCGAIWRP